MKPCPQLAYKTHQKHYTHDITQNKKDLWDTSVGAACTHPDGSEEYEGHAGTIATNAQATFVLRDKATSGVVTQLCPGKNYSVSLTVPQQNFNSPHIYLTSSQGTFSPVQGDIVRQCTGGGASRAPVFAATTFDTDMALPCSASTSVVFKVTYAIRGAAFKQAELTATVDAGCAANTCEFWVCCCGFSWRCST